MNVQHRLAAKQARDDLIIEHDGGVDVDEVGATEASRGARQRGRQNEDPRQREPRQRLSAEHEQRLENDCTRHRLQRFDDRPGARQHDLDIGVRERLANRGDAFDETTIRAIELVALVHTGDPHP